VNAPAAPASSTWPPAKVFAPTAALIVMAIGLAVLAGWALDLPLLKTALPSLAQMKANTALCAVFCGAALWLQCRRLRPWSLPAAGVLVGLVEAIALATLAEYALGRDFGIDQLMFTDKISRPPGRPTEAVCVMLVLAGLSLWLLRGGVRAVACAQGFALALGGLALVGTLGHLFGAGSLHAVGPFRSFALPTAVAMLALALGLLCAAPAGAPIAVFFRTTPSSRMARLILFACFTLLPVLALLRLQGEYLRWYGTEFGLALMITAALTVIAVVTGIGAQLSWQSEKLLARANRLYVALSATNQAIVHAATRDDLLQRVCRAAVADGGFAIAWIGLTDSGTDGLRAVASAGAPAGFVAGSLAFLHDDPAASKRVRGALGGAAQVINDLAATPPGPRRNALLACGLEAAAVLPINSEGQVRGLFYVYAREKNFFQVEEQALLMEMAGDVGFALDRLNSEEKRRAAELEVQRLNAALEQRVAERTAALEGANADLSAFNYSVSHDLRAPLRHVRGFISMAQEEAGAALPAGPRALLDRAAQAATRMNTLVDDMLRLSQTRSADFTPLQVDVSAMAAGILHDLAQRDPQRQVQVSVEPGLSAVCDPNLLRILLDNLLGNAWKYSAKAAQARIEFGRDPQAGPEQMAYRVRDNGAGFDMAYAGKLFAPFQRLHSDAEFSGTGIGLAIVKRVIDRHGGRIWAQAEPGAGASFMFTLAGNKAGETTA
jgi:signal transduction histidine kinase